MALKVLYFAWVRERIGKAEEVLEPPGDVVTVADLVAWLKGRGEEYAYAFENESVIRAAMDQIHVKRDAVITSADEIAFFPPMTGG
jgi:molybdopterin synthase sulfur carrier subunit